ncbi:GSCOCG00007399001-RA-CDS, partial [Cotesia congregata]
LSTPLKIAAILSTLATFIRCLSIQATVFTTTAHIAAIVNGFSGVIIGPATALVSAVWFPTGERTTATGISSAASQVGMAISYVLGPGLVGISHVNSTISLRSQKSANIYRIAIPAETSVYQTSLQIQIMSLMRIEFVVQCLVLIGILTWFPKQSQISNSNIQVSTLGLLESLIKLIK